MTGMPPRFARACSVFTQNGSIQQPFTNIEQLLYNPSFIDSSSLSLILPYQSMNTEQLFINNHSVGFGLHLLPATSPNKRLITSLMRFIQHLPLGLDCNIIFHKHQHLQTTLRRGLQPLLHHLAPYSSIANRILDIYSDDILLFETQCYLFVSGPTQNMQQLVRYRQTIEKALTQMHWSHARIDATDFLIFLHSNLNPDFNSLQWPIIADTQQQLLNRLVPKNTWFIPQSKYVDIEFYNAQYERICTRVTNCQLHEHAFVHAMHAAPFEFPYLVSANFRKTQIDKAPTCFYNLMLFTTAENQAHQLKQATTCFNTLGITITPAFNQQWTRFLASMPFMITERYFSELIINRQMAPTVNMVSKLVLMQNRKGSPQGLLLPTTNKEIAFLDTFDQKNLPIRNYNYVIIANTEHEAYRLQALLLLNGLSMGEMIFVIDFNGIYQSLTEALKGITLTPHVFIETKINNSTFVVIDMTVAYDLQQILCKFQEYIQQYPNKKIRFIFSSISRLLSNVESIQALLLFIKETSIYFCGIGIMTTEFDEINSDLLGLCELKLILNAQIKHYAQRHQLSVTSIEETQTTSYDEILVQAGCIHSLHRLKKFTITE